ncbi:MAG TPA: hypothetical protein VNJ07_08625, partial [Chitinophagales bacterium]|nr:hypothetical protein [Chitinophagales bacterium]
HQCRIHFLELRDVSKEPGICLNEPVKNKADKDKCVDLHIKDEADHEAFSPQTTTSSCNTKDLFQEARTKKPVKEYAIKIYSRDFGSYGFLRSYANINTNPSEGQVSGTPLYYSIGVKKSEVTHPAGRPKKKEYKDNRVTIPMDIDENKICDGGWTASIGSAAIADPPDNKADTDNTPSGDGNNGDGYSNYEEYRGFKVTQPAVAHVRLNNKRKDLFINNEDNLPVANFETASGLTVHLIDEAHYNKNTERYVNFNYATAHAGLQRGLHLVDGGNSTELLGIALGDNNRPNPPNWELRIVVYTNAIQRHCTARRLNYNTKLTQVTSHELGHGCNVFHHGETNGANGLRSGDLSCIMRYDNQGAAVETPGSIFCTGANGTGANQNPNPNAGFGACANGRGNCIAQFRVNHNTPYPNR